MLYFHVPLTSSEENTQEANSTNLTRLPPPVLDSMVEAWLILPTASTTLRAQCRGPYCRTFRLARADLLRRTNRPVPYHRKEM